MIFHEVNLPCFFADLWNGTAQWKLIREREGACSVKATTQVGNCTQLHKSTMLIEKLQSTGFVAALTAVVQATYLKRIFSRCFDSSSLVPMHQNHSNKRAISKSSSRLNIYFFNRSAERIAAGSMPRSYIFYNSAITKPVVCARIVIEIGSHLTKMVPVQSHNSFLDQKSRKVIV